jgi:hypothetical protein
MGSVAPCLFYRKSSGVGKYKKKFQYHFSTNVHIMHGIIFLRVQIRMKNMENDYKGFIMYRSLLIIQKRVYVKDFGK